MVNKLQLEALALTPNPNPNPIALTSPNPIYNYIALVLYNNTSSVSSTSKFLKRFRSSGSGLNVYGLEIITEIVAIMRELL